MEPVEPEADKAPVSEASGVVKGWNLDGPAPYLIAHYLPWFETNRASAPAAEAWAHWRWRGAGIDHDPERRRSDGLRDLATAHYPLIGPYATTDRAVLDYHFGTLRAAGVQAIIVLWYGPGSRSDAAMPAIFEAAEAAGLRVAPCYEEKINWPGYREPASRTDLVHGAVSDLSSWMTRYGAHPAHLRRGNDPVLFQFNYWGADNLGPRTFLPAEWRAIRSGVGRSFVYVRQNLDAGHHPALEGAYGWWMPDASERRGFVERAAEAVTTGGLEFFMTMIAPGFDDGGVGGWGGGRRYTARGDGATLRATQEDALAGGPELVQLVTWNDFNEGTEFEPSVENGFSALDAVETWWAKAHGRPAPDLANNRAPLRAYLAGLDAAARADVPALAWALAGLETP